MSISFFFYFTMSHSFLHQFFLYHFSLRSQSTMSNQDQPKCPVDHSTRSSWTLLLWKSNDNPAPESCMKNDPVDQPKCPVDINTRTDWLKKVSISASVQNEDIEQSCASDSLSQTPARTTSSTVALPTERVISSIPRTSADTNWVYPSEKQFYEAMMRKNWNPKAEDMKAVVPIHNMVNERTWNHILNWERAYYEDSMKKCGGIKLTSFKGDPNKLTPRAWFRSSVLGMEKPFDRHDWVIDRCGTEVEYVIDFYPGKDADVFLDVRPKLNTLEGVKLRVGRAFGWN